MRLFCEMATSLDEGKVGREIFWKEKKEGRKEGREDGYDRLPELISSFRYRYSYVSRKNIFYSFEGSLNDHEALATLSFSNSLPYPLLDIHSFNLSKFQKRKEKNTSPIPNNRKNKREFASNVL